MMCIITMYVHVQYLTEYNRCTCIVHIVIIIITCMFVVSLKVLLLAMKDMNVAKLTAADLPLFNGITSDLFPGVDVPTLDYSIVSNTCTCTCSHVHVHVHVHM